MFKVVATYTSLQHTFHYFMKIIAIPAKLLDKVLCRSADLFRELDCVDTTEDDVVGTHRVRARERRAARSCDISTHTNHVMSLTFQ